MGYIEKGRAKTFTKIMLWLVVLSFVAAIFVTWGAQRSGIQFGTATAITINGVTLTPDDLFYYQNFYRFVTMRINAVSPIVESQLWYTLSSSIGISLGTSILQYTGDPESSQLLENMLLTIGDYVLADKARAAGLRVEMAFRNLTRSFSFSGIFEPISRDSSRSPSSTAGSISMPPSISASSARWRATQRLQ